MVGNLKIFIVLWVLIYPPGCLGTGRTFPRAGDYPFGIRPDAVSQDAMNQDCLKAYEAFVKEFITSDGCPPGAAYRVHLGNAVVFEGTEPRDTYSEGIGWGMLFSVIMDNGKNQAKQYFDGLNAYRKNYRKSSGLMNWHIGYDGVPKATGIAVEADENMAMALVLAHSVWGSTPDFPYQQEAMEILEALMNTCVQKPEMFMKPGDTWGGYDLVHPCNFDVGFYDTWSDFSGNSDWKKVKTASYDILDKIYRKFSTGFLPHWCDAEGNKTTGKNEYFSDYTFEYDALQTAIKIPLDYLIYGGQTHPMAVKIPNSLSKSIRTLTGNNARAITATGYELHGRIIGHSSLNVTFLAAFGVSSMVSAEHREWCNDIYDLLRKQKTGGQFGYYRDMIRLFSLIIMSGNFPRPDGL